MEMPLERDLAGWPGLQFARVAVAFVDGVHDQAGCESIVQMSGTCLNFYECSFYNVRALKHLIV